MRQLPEGAAGSSQPDTETFTPNVEQGAFEFLIDWSSARLRHSMPVKSHRDGCLRLRIR